MYRCSKVGAEIAIKAAMCLPANKSKRNYSKIYFQMNSNKIFI